MASSTSGFRNLADVTCFFCHQKGHFANVCPKKAGAAPRPNGGRGQGSGHPPDQKVIQKTQPAGSGRVTHVSAEEAQEAPDVVMGTFLVHSYPATVLFDSGASHSFISSSFATMGDFPLFPLEIPLLIRSPGMELRAGSECRDVLIEIEGVDFLANLILLDSATLDVILGMDWLSQHLGQIDCARKVVHLTSSSGAQIGFSPKLHGPHLFALEAKPTPQLSEIPTVLGQPIHTKNNVQCR